VSTEASESSESTQNRKYYETLVKPGKKCVVGAELIFGEGLLRAKVVKVFEDGNRLIEFSYRGIWEEVLAAVGQMPLPPYITHTLFDQDRYQTVYAKFTGSAAAPTAGLHFTNELLERVRAKGILIASVTLHVGLGTFRPVKEEFIKDHHMHTEHYHISEKAAEQINQCRQSGHRVICVGTTSCRTLESAAVYNSEQACWTLQAQSADTDIFLYPGSSFHLTDGLITNFHLPQSTLLMLVSAFAGREATLTAYEEAIRSDYRFFSFGDAMLII
jgi:S-adenosylmethionine:tRNA ribosyltransferase-isomerase